MMDEDVQPDDVFFSARFKILPGAPPRELLRLTPEGRVFAFTDNGKAWEIDAQVLYEALRKFRQH